MDTLTKNKNRTSILDITHINDTSFKLRLERNGIDFEPGQHVYLGFDGERASREYSIYSSKNDDYLDFLIKVVDDGKFTTRLKQVKIGDQIFIQGPFGFFTLSEIHKTSACIFIATGTGIAPFHSMIMSNPELNYTILHGIRNQEDVYDIEDYTPSKRIICTSREHSKFFKGRVTDYLQKIKLAGNAHYFLCGNSNMIEDVQDILENKGIHPLNIKTEIYF